MDGEPITGYYRMDVSQSRILQDGCEPITGYYRMDGEPITGYYRMDVRQSQDTTGWM